MYACELLLNSEYNQEVKSETADNIAAVDTVAAVVAEDTVDSINQEPAKKKKRRPMPGLLKIGPSLSRNVNNIL